MIPKPSLKKFVWPKAEDQQDQEIFHQVKQQQWHALFVPTQQGKPGYGFTVGHYLYHQRPEIIIVGAPEKIAKALLDKVAAHNKGDLAQLQTHKLYRQFINGLDAVFVPVMLEHYNQYLGFNNWFYDSLSHAYPVWQLVWPDPQGKFPWQQGYDVRFANLQPVLGPVPTLPPQATRLH